MNFLQFPIELTCWPQAPPFFSTGRNSILSVSIRIRNTSAKPSHAGPLNTWFVDHFHSLNFYGANIAVNAEAISGRRYKYTDMRFQDRLSEFTVLDSSCSPSGNNNKKKKTQSGLEGGHLLLQGRGGVGGGAPTAAALSQAMWRRASCRSSANHPDTLLSLRQRLGNRVLRCDVSSHTFRSNSGGPGESELVKQFWPELR